MIKAHHNQTTQKTQTGGTNLTNVPAQAQFPTQRTPASDVRIPYQLNTPSSNKVVQCFRFGAWLREKFCCGDGQEPELPQPNGFRADAVSRYDGPCAIAALKGLGWYQAGDELKNRIQTAQFGNLGHLIDDAAAIENLGREMILFFRPGDPVPFHVMYTDDEGNLYGANNDYSMLARKFNLTSEDFKIDRSTLPGCPLAKICIKNRILNPEETTIIKSISFSEYASFKL